MSWVGCQTLISSCLTSKPIAGLSAEVSSSGKLPSKLTSPVSIFGFGISMSYSLMSGRFISVSKYSPVLMFLSSPPTPSPIPGKLGSKLKSLVGISGSELSMSNSSPPNCGFRAEMSRSGWSAFVSRSGLLMPKRRSLLGTSVLLSRAFVSNSDEGLLPEILRPGTSASVSKSPPEIDGLLIATLGASGRFDPGMPQSALPCEL